MRGRRGSGNQFENLAGLIRTKTMYIWCRNLSRSSPYHTEGFALSWTHQKHRTGNLQQLYTSHQLWISPSKKEKKWSHMKVRHDFQNSKGLVQTQKQTCLDYFGYSAKHRQTPRWGAKTQQADLESRYATAITASVNALFCSCLLAFKALTLNAAASHASHPCWTGEGTALQTQLIRFHSWHFWHC